MLPVPAIVLVLLACAAANPHANPTCEASACGKCFDSCAPFSEQTALVQRCDRMLRLASSLPARDAEDACKMSKCASLQLNQLCGVVRLPTKSSLRDKNIRLDNRIRASRERLSILPEYAKDQYRTLSQSRLDYDRRVEQRLTSIKLNFDDALETRKKYLRQREFLQSVDFRSKMLKVKRLHLENDQLRARVRYWKLKMNQLRSDVGSNPRTLETSRKKLRNELNSLNVDLSLLRGLKDDEIPHEQKVILLMGTRLRAEKQLKDIKTQIANARAQEQFMKEASREILNLLKQVKDDISSKKTLVPCGPWVLTDLITRSLMSSMSILF